MITKHRHYLDAWGAGFRTGKPFTIRKETNWCYVLTIHPKPYHGDGRW